MNITRAGCLLLAMSGSAGLLLPHAARAQTPASGFVGRWQLNLAQSKSVSGEVPPGNLLTQIDRADAEHVHWSTTTTDAQGQKDVETFDNPGNGQFYSLDGYTMVSHTLSPSSLVSTFKGSGGQTDVLTCTLSGAGKRMTCIGVITNTDKSIAQYTDVVDRV